MKTEQLQNWLHIAGLTGVILSLVFVGLEIQQSRQIAIADIYQQRTAILIDVQTARLTAEPLHQAIRKKNTGEDLDALERGLLYIGHIPIFSYWENNHFQYQMGLMSEEQWNASRNALRDYLRFDSDRMDWWAAERSQVRKSFADEVDRILAEE